jgi:hypothetical protein
MSRTLFGSVIAAANTGLVGLLIVRGVEPGWPLAAIIGGGYLFAGLLIDPAEFRAIAAKIPGLSSLAKPPEGE